MIYKIESLVFHIKAKMTGFFKKSWSLDRILFFIHASFFFCTFLYFWESDDF